LVNDNTATNLMAAIMAGGLDCWALLDVKPGEKPRFVGAGTTTISEDKWLKRRNLVIYSLYAQDYVTKDAWNAVLTAVLKHAQEQGCQGVIAYTDNPRAIEIAKALGFNTNIRVAEMEL